MRGFGGKKSKSTFYGLTGIVLLFIFMLIQAYVAHSYRTLQGKLQETLDKRSRLAHIHQQLLLERRTHFDSGQVERRARAELGMKIPREVRDSMRLLKNTASAGDGNGN